MKIPFHFTFTSLTHTHSLKCALDSTAKLSPAGRRMIQNLRKRSPYVTGHFLLSSMRYKCENAKTRGGKSHLNLVQALAKRTRETAEEEKSETEWTNSSYFACCCYVAGENDDGKLVEKEGKLDFHSHIARSFFSFESEILLDLNINSKLSPKVHNECMCAVLTTHSNAKALSTWHCKTTVRLSF